jgi:peptidoglycan/xylan/chitin deacetylase (PgdA/CDA1 family)
MESKMKLSITVDVERDLGSKESYFGIDEGLPFILELMSKESINGTFFINSEALEYLDKKGLIKAIHNLGHEIASHSNKHIDYRELPDDSIMNDIIKSKTDLEGIIGSKVVGYRSPQFRVNLKIINILKEVGFRYDSSIPKPGCFSAARLLRKVNFSKDEIDQINSTIKEFYISCQPVLSMPHGLLWLTKYNFALYKFFFRKLKDNPIILYLHPFDLVENKNQIQYNSLLQEYFYKINSIKPKRLFTELVKFWKNEGLEFAKLKDSI